MTETGSSLRTNKLRIVETMRESTTWRIAQKKAWQDPWKRKKIENMAILLQGALASEEKVGLKMNVPKKVLTEITSILPAMHSPTTSQQTDPAWVSLEVMPEEK